ncbi:hypothetical protein B0T16DRAFT_411172 [Cercophora newfieldiana]|uniref:Uncharacterized protein n=1 Tax=Cercophora newfieldiana TaxID=92897 RepID=A0AA39Y3M8_9PEZI|nr:hypothetical protein B0T16DRAFT_411172 [Cercophora newfieldiana]
MTARPHIAPLVAVMSSHSSQSEFHKEKSQEEKSSDSRSQDDKSQQNVPVRTTGAFEFPESKPKRPDAACVDATPDGRVNVAYLTGNSVHIFAWFSPKAQPRSLKSIQIEEECSRKWTGVALGGTFLTVWGRPGEGTGAFLEVRKIESSPKIVRIETPPDEIGWFDVDKRVAVSREGYVALIRHQKLVIVNLNSKPTKTFTIETPQTIQPFTDVAFNDTGKLLYAWATASSNASSAGLFIYRIDTHSKPEDPPVSKSYYAPRVNDSFATQLIPYNTEIGCIIAANNQYYYPAVTNPRDDSARQQRCHSEAIRKSHLKASTMYDNRFLVTIQRGGLLQRRRYRLVKYPLHSLEGDSHYFGGPIELATVEMNMGRPRETEFIVIQFQGYIYTFIVSLDGRYEIIPIKDVSRLDGATGTDNESVISKGEVQSELAA